MISACVRNARAVRRPFWCAVWLASLVFSGFARAQVLEPNGLSVPIDAVTSETSLQEYFDAEGETIDAVAQASTNPQVFSPLCDFQATLVLSGSGTTAAIAWYNVPADPNAAPDAVYTIVPDDTPVGEVVNAAAIREDPNYAEGLIGFVLMKYGQRAYYTEYQRNVFCSGCETPDYWKMALTYPSTLYENTYYLAFEDWEGADASSWQGNDGDFNDKVFRFTGVSCVGGGEACDTGKIGACGVGLTECSFDGGLVCKQQIPEQPESCDNVDNDCNGEVDDGDLCDEGKVCVQGRCVDSCLSGEFPCRTGLVCSAGFCIDPACDGVVCEAGKVCRGGTCEGACDGVVCPLGQECQLGRCVNLCANVVCDAGAVCEKGVCVATCSCRGCPVELECAASGSCVEPGCDITCDVGQACSGGACVDACANAVCPGGASCLAGECGEPVPGSDSGGTGSGGGIGIDTGSGGIVIGAGGTSSGSGASNGTGASSGVADKREVGEPGCACRQSAPPRGRAFPLGLALALLLGRRARGPRARSPRASLS